MPGTFIVRPIEANLTHNTDFLKKMNPYCSIAVGNTRVKGQICKHGGKHPHWNDAITLPATNESQVLVQLMDKDRITHDDNIGSFMLNLQEVQQAGQVSKWYPLYYKNKAAGEILLETIYQGDGTGAGYQQQGYLQGQQQYTDAGYVAGGSYASGEQYGQNQYYQQEQLGQNQYYQQEQVLTSQPEVIQKEEIITTTTTQPTTVVQEEVVAADTGRHGNVWTEQRQVVEPHTFIKEVEVVETRPAMKEIEVMEPVKVLKEVPYTQAVPVKKQIEVMEPQVVMKEVEVIEPRLVTKTIQVVENVPVTRQVEVVEMRNAIQEVQTVEPQTFTKQVEVTEYVPVRKQVEVTQPVTLKKAVEFVEPVITTQTITKQMQEAVIIDEQVTTTVGPASVIGISQEYGYIQNWGEISSTERERIGAHQRWTGYEHIFHGLNDQERLFEQQRLSRLNEQQWLSERARLLALGEQQRLLEQRNTYKNYYATNKGGFSNTGATTGLSSGQYSTGLSSGQYSTGHHSTGISGGHKRHHGFEKWFHGLNEKERQFEQERWNRMSEQEWLQEQQRLGGFNDQDRLLEQRRHYNDYLQTGGFSTYKKTTEVIEKTNQGAPSFFQGSQGFVQGSQNVMKGTESYGRPSKNMNF